MRFPYGIADFRKIREGGYFYVDRTDRIPLLEEAGIQLLFLRPRRFGKSLWLSTLENYYDLARADDFDRLFGGLKIGQNPRRCITAISFSSSTCPWSIPRVMLMPSPPRSTAMSIPLSKRSPCSTGKC